MLGEGAHVYHDQFRATKHSGVDALKDKVLLLFNVKGCEVGIVDVAATVLLDVQDLAFWSELFCDREESVQGFVPFVSRRGMSLPIMCVSAALSIHLSVILQ